MQLSDLIVSVTTKFENTKDMEKRLTSAVALATKYKFTHPKMVLFFTHPELSKKPLRERCEIMDMTEEEFMMAFSEEGFQKFLTDFKNMAVLSLQTQSFEKLGDSIQSNRVKFDKNGNESEDLTVELQMTEMAVPRPAQVQVNNNTQVNTNTLWSRARERARSAAPQLLQSTAVEVPTQTTSVEVDDE